jgi:hypothetical protein
MREPIQITRSGAVANATPDALQELQRHFAKSHCILLPSLIDPGILEIVLERISKGQFATHQYKHVGTESRLPDDSSVSTLDFLMNVPAFLKLMERVTSCAPIALFSGRIYRMAPDEGHHFDWHADMETGDPRLLALSLNLSPEPFEGGELEMRETETKRVIHRVRNTGLGDAIVFRVAAFLEHRVAPVRGTVPKTAYTGWFRPRSSDYPADFHNLVRSVENQPNND